MGQILRGIEALKGLDLPEIKLILHLQRDFAIGKLREEVADAPICGFKQSQRGYIFHADKDVCGESGQFLSGEIDRLGLFVEEQFSDHSTGLMQRQPTLKLLR